MSSTETIHDTTIDCKSTPPAHRVQYRVAERAARADYPHAQLREEVGPRARRTTIEKQTGERTERGKRGPHRSRGRETGRRGFE